MAPHGKELSNDLKETIILRHQKGDGYKKISNAVHIYKQEYQSQSGAKLQEERECNGCVTTSWPFSQTNTTFNTQFIEGSGEEPESKCFWPGPSSCRPVWSCRVSSDSETHSARTQLAWPSTSEEATTTGKTYEGPFVIRQCLCHQIITFRGEDTVVWRDKDRQPLRLRWYPESMAPTAWGIQLGQLCGAHSEAWWQKCHGLGQYEWHWVHKA